MLLLPGGVGRVCSPVERVSSCVRRAAPDEVRVVGHRRAVAALRRELAPGSACATPRDRLLLAVVRSPRRAPRRRLSSSASISQGLRARGSSSLLPVGGGASTWVARTISSPASGSGGAAARRGPRARAAALAALGRCDDPRAVGDRAAGRAQDPPRARRPVSRITPGDAEEDGEDVGADVCDEPVRAVEQRLPEDAAVGLQVRRASRRRCRCRARGHAERAGGQRERDAREQAERAGAQRPGRRAAPGASSSAAPPAKRDRREQPAPPRAQPSAAATPWPARPPSQPR